MKRMMRAAALVACVGAMICFAGCGGGSPESVAVKFAERLSAQDFEGASKLCTKETGALFVAMGGMMKEDDDFKKLKGAKFAVDSCKIDGDSATVKLKCTLKSGEVDEKGDGIDLVKQDGEWKVNVKKD